MLSLASLTAYSQSLWTSADFKARIAKGLSVNAEVDYRTTDQLKATQRVAGSFGLDYKIIKPLKISSGYTYIHQHIDTEVTNKGNIIPAYWQPKHRFYFDVTGSVNWNRFNFSLRERYQMTHRKEQSVPKFDEDGVTQKKDELIDGKTNNMLRSRLQVEYNIKHSRFVPYVSAEIYNSLSDSFDYDKFRFTVGSEYKLNKHNSLSIYYRYITNSDQDEHSGHILGVGYKFKL
jgi:hypothetical protein